MALGGCQGVTPPPAMTPDCDLLHQYVEQHDEAAFAEVVRRNVDLVYSVALRQLAGDTHLAEDVTQAVFLDLVRKAQPLSRRATLAGWLHTSARLAAWKAVRGEQRRRAREQESLAMNETPTTAEMNWEQLQPLLDEGVGQLDEKDQDAIVLRYFEGKSHREVGTALGLSENSANKRIERALEKLRGYFARRGVTVPAAVLAAEVSSNSVQAAPAGLAAQVTRTSLAGAGKATLGGAILLGLFMNTKTKITVGLAVILILATAVVFEWQKVSSPKAPDATAGASHPAAPANSLAKTLIVANRGGAGSGVALPVQSAVPAMSGAAATTTVASAAVAEYVAGPQADLQMAIATGLHFLGDQDFVGFLKTLMPPEALASENKGATYEDFANEISKNADMAQTLTQLVEALKRLDGQTPNMNDDQTRATYPLDPPVGKHQNIIFIKVDGVWYLNGM